MASLTLARKYFERAKIILEENEKNQSLVPVQIFDFGPKVTAEQKARQYNVIMLAFKHLDANMLQSDLKLFAKLIIENRSIEYSIVYAVRKALDCTGAHRFLQDKQNAEIEQGHNS